MFGQFFRRQARGHAIEAATLNRPGREAARHSRLRVAGGMAQVVFGGIPLVRGRAAVGTSFWASLTSHVAGGSYHFIRLKESGTSFVTTSTSGTAYDVNGNATIVTPVIVRVFLDPGSHVYRFQYHSCS